MTADGCAGLTIGDLRLATKPLGLSLGELPCLALAIDPDVEIYTADAALARVNVAITVTNVRA